MTKFTYMGGKEFDGTDLPSVVHLFGHEFKLGEAVEVSDDDKNAIETLKKHKHFKEGSHKVAPPPEKKDDHHDTATASKK